MPELPEVETIRLQLKKYLPLQIKSSEQTGGLTQNILKTDLKNLAGQIIVNIERKGKMLDFVFADGSHLLSHLGMTGTWLVGTEVKVTKHTHLILKSQNLILAYDDPRRFGKMYFLSQENSKIKLDSMGLDLVDPRLDLDYLKKSLQKFPEKYLKVALLDQKYFAGSGNYIANEICARAGIKPNRKIKKITAQEFPKILKAIHQVIKPALAAGGTTFQGGYRDSTGEYGQGKSNLVVFYQKICQLCKKTKVKKITLAQRGTYYCSHCQK